MIERKKSLKSVSGIVSRRKPKKTGVGSKCPKKDSDLRKFNLSIPNELFLQVVEVAKAKNMKVNAFISNALRAELAIPTIPAAPLTSSTLNELNTFLEGMSALDWAQIMTEENTKKLYADNR